MKITRVSFLVSILFLTRIITARSAEKNSEFDPTFNQELIEMDPSDEFLDASKILDKNV